MTNPRDVVSAERLIHAPAAAIFDVIADPARHPEIDGSGTVLKARPGSSSRLSAGATFGMDMKLGVRYGMVSTVTEFDEGRLIAWSPKPASGRGARFIGRIWRYELEPVEDGTREGFRFFLRYANASRTKRDMAKSLERLDKLVTSGP